MPELLIISYYFPPAATPGVHRTLRFTRYLPEFGWSPSVVACDPESHNARRDAQLSEKVPAGTTVRFAGYRRPEERLKDRLRLLRGKWLGPARPEGGGRARSGANGANSAKQTSDYCKSSWSYRLKEFALWTPDKAIAWKRPAVRAACELFERHPANVVYGTGPPFTTHVAAAEISRRCGLPLVLDFRDPWARCPWGPRVSGRAALLRLRSLERRCVGQAQRVILNTERLREDFRESYPDQDPDKFVTIPNGFDPDLAERILKRLPQSSPGGSQRLLLLHPGSLYSDRDPRPLLAALAELAEQGQQVEFEQLGPCEAGFAVADNIQQLGLSERVRVHKAVPHDEMLDRMAQADAFVLLQPNNDLQVPGKLFEMMLFGKPILAIVDDGATADIVRRYELGVACPNTQAGIADTVRQLLAMDTTQAAEESRRRALRDFNGRALAGRLAHLLDEVLG